MNNVMISDNCVVKMNHDDSLIIVNGIRLPPPPTKGWNVTNINGKVYIDGYEFKNGKWKKTLRAWWHMWF